MRLCSVRNFFSGMLLLNFDDIRSSHLWMVLVAVSVFLNIHSFIQPRKEPSKLLHVPQCHGCCDAEIATACARVKPRVRADAVIFDEKATKRV